MIRANIEAAIQAKLKEMEKNDEELKKVDNLINNLKSERNKLLDKDTDLYYEIEELKEKLECIE